MSRNLVERYEQILASDPTSSVFVELAKALLDGGDAAKSIDVCQQGLLHHNASVVGRVLWGKALITLGRPAEAMEQFDRAVAIDRDNPHAYNLIGEVLLTKGLYRSALPLLRKAAVLQPNDDQVRRWLEQTQAALNGGPPPVLPAQSLIDAEVQNEMKQAAAAGAAAASQAAEGQQTDLNVPALQDAEPALQATVPNAKALSELSADRSAERTEIHSAYAPPPPQWFAPPVSISAEPPSSSRELDLERTMDGDIPRPAEDTGALAELPSPGPAAMNTEAMVPEPPGWDEPAPGDPPETASLATAPPEPRRGGAPVRGRDGLLDDIPDQADFGHSGVLEIPKVELSPAAAEAIAKEYERELREKLAEKSEEKTFLQRNGTWLAVLAVLGLAALSVTGMVLYLRKKHNGHDLKDSMAEAKKAFVLDTVAGYRSGLDALSTALSMDSSNEEALAMMAYAHSLLYAEHGQAPEEKSAAEKALVQGQVDSQFPALALVSSYYLATEKDRTRLRQAVLDANLEQTEVQELAGRILLQKKDTKGARARFKRALDLAHQTNVRALVALGDYYREAQDYQNALLLYATATQLSPHHLQRAVGDAETHIALGSDYPVALAALQAVPASEDAPSEVLARRELATGRLLALTGSAPTAIERLKSADAKYPGHAFEFALARAEATRLGGDMAAAQSVYELSLKLNADSEDAKDGLARVLMAEDKERELLARIAPRENERKLWLVRGAALAKLGAWKPARAELQKTQVGGKYPLESVMYLALADAAEGQAERAQQVLEKALAASKKTHSELSVALGQVYWQRGALDKARAQFEEASKDPFNYEAPCALGRLWVLQGELQKALEPLTQAVARNASHGEARHALGRAYLASGKTEEGLAQAQSWQAMNPSSSAAQRDYAFALYLGGRFKDAETASKRAVSLNNDDAEAHRVRAAVLFGRGDGKDAFNELEHANRLNPKDPETFCAIGHAFMRQANGDHAQKAFEAALREQPNAACAKIGSIAARLPTAPKTSAKELGDLLQNAPQVWDRAGAAATLARVQLSGNNLREAKKAAEKAVELGPFLSDAYFAQAMVAQRSRDEVKARDAFAKAAALDPTDGSVHLAYADTLMRTEGGLPQAFIEYQTFLKLNGPPREQTRVKKLLPTLKKRLAQR